MKKFIKCLKVIVITIACACSSDSLQPRKAPILSENARLVSIHLDGNAWRSFDYSANGLLSSYTIHNGETFLEFVYYYNTNGLIDSVQEIFNGSVLNTTIVYSYSDKTKIEKLEYKTPDNTVFNVATYTYTDNLLTNIDNSDKSIGGLHYRNFEYDDQNNVSRISANQGNDQVYTYHTDKTVLMPLHFDISDPINTTTNLIETFTSVAYSSYTASYEFDGRFVTKETRVFPRRNVGTSGVPPREVYTYTYAEF